jgi:copper homeostasis protein
MKLELCAYSLEDCLTAAAAGFHQVELCASPADGGTTPSGGLVKLVKEKIALNINVMIRPRGGDFLYSASEIAVMKADILLMKELGAKGVVLGVLQADGQVDKELLRELVELAAPLEVVFHRAFDLALDPKQALEDIIEAGCKRLLTSGQALTAQAGINVIEQLVKQAQGRIEIMVGSGVSSENVHLFKSVGISCFHTSARAYQESAMEYRKAGMVLTDFEGISDYQKRFADASKLQKMREIVSIP